MKVIVAIYDRTTEAFTPPMAVRTRAEAVRSLRQEMSQKESQIAQHPTDFELWQVGEWNEETGELTGNKDLIARAEDHVQGA